MVIPGHLTHVLQMDEEAPGQHHSFIKHCMTRRLRLPQLPSSPHCAGNATPMDKYTCLACTMHSGHGSK